MSAGCLFHCEIVAGNEFSIFALAAARSGGSESKSGF